jgi:hypothetical protein
VAGIQELLAGFSRMRNYRQDLARLMDRESSRRLVGSGNSSAPRLIEQGREAEEDLEEEEDDPFKKYEDLPLDHEGQDG